MLQAVEFTNSGCNESRHDGIHTFHVEKNCNVRYVEKHYGEGERNRKQESSTRSQKFILARIPYLHLIPHR